jgi:hypothetical protein
MIYLTIQISKIQSNATAYRVRTINTHPLTIAIIVIIAVFVAYILPNNSSVKSKTRQGKEAFSYSEYLVDIKGLAHIQRYARRRTYLIARLTDLHYQHRDSPQLL